MIASGAMEEPIDEILPVAINREDVPSGSVDGPTTSPNWRLLTLGTARRSHPGHYVAATNVKRDQETGEKIEVQYIKSERLLYDRRTGEYSVPGKGRSLSLAS